ncbi:MAG: SDR family NAD(P)-dependent oxidoreductase [Polyangiales bacterium]
MTIGSLQGRVALVTGASRGIGAAIAARLSHAGAQVAVVGRDASTLAAFASTIGAFPCAADVTTKGASEDILARVRATLGEVDIVVANAGIDASFKLTDTTDEVFEAVMASNVTSVFRLCRAAIPSMIARKFGRVVVIASNAGLVGYAYSAAYCASKHAVVGLVRAIAAEIATTEVTINAVCPGFVDTDMARRAIDRIAQKTGRDHGAARAALERMSPQQRLVDPAEVAYLVLSLLPHDARGVHGQALAIDGGQTFG